MTAGPRSIRLGLLLSQAGEFGFVLFAQAASAQLITPEAASLFGAVVTLSMVATPFLMRLIDWLAAARGPSGEVDLDGPEFSPETNAIVVGYGRFGQTVAQMLQAKRIPVTLIDSKPAQIELAEEFGTKVYYGDGLRASTCCGPRAPRPPKTSCSARTMRRGTDRAKRRGGARGLPPGGGDGPRVRPAPADGARRARPRLRPARAVRKRRGDGPRGAAQAAGSHAAKSSGSSANIAMRDCERLERQSATGDLHAGSDRHRSAPTARFRRRAGHATRPRPRCAWPRCSSSARTIDSTTSRCAPSPLFTWMCGLGIGLPLGLREALERALGVAVAEQRAGVAARRALGEHVDRRVEPDRDRPLVEQLAGARIDEHAAAGGDHPHLAVDQPRDQPPLAVAIILLAVALEHLGRGKADASSIAESLSTNGRPAAWPAAGRRSICRRPSGRRERSGDRDAWPTSSRLKGYTAAGRGRQKPA